LILIKNITICQISKVKCTDSAPWSTITDVNELNRHESSQGPSMVEANKHKRG